MPQVGQQITIDLPDERTRAEVVKVISDSACLAKIMQFTTASKSHPYHKDDIVAVQYKRDGMGLNAWIAIEERPAAPSAETVAALADADESDEEEEDDAVAARVEPEGDKREHPRADAARKSAKVTRSDRSHRVA